MRRSSYFNDCSMTLRAGVSRSHRERVSATKWVDLYTAVFRRKMLFIYSGSPLESISQKSHSHTLWVWCFSIVSTPLFAAQMSFSPDLFFTANRLLLGLNEYSNVTLACALQKITPTESSPGREAILSRVIGFQRISSVHAPQCFLI